jgi:uncharacterized protein
LLWIPACVVMGWLVACSGHGVAAGAEAVSPDELLLKDYRPRSIFKVPETRVERARFPVIDVHSHAYAKTEAEVDRWVRTMDEVGIERTVVLTGAIGKRFDELVALYGRYPDRFDLWCGIDYTGFDQPGFGPGAVAELERCVRAGARGVGELSDKGGGLRGNSGGMHLDDPRMDVILEKCAELGLPVNIHVGEDRWMYEPMDAHNDGLMNAFKWRIPERPDVLRHDAVIATLDRAARRHPRTTFIACHFANCCYDLSILGGLFEAHPNLYADISARFGETAPIPRATAQFYETYQDRLLYGTDMGFNPGMYRTTFRILETQDEHFYEQDLFNYHWPLHAFGLRDTVLRKLYADNARRVLKLAAHPVPPPRNSGSPLADTAPVARPAPQPAADGFRWWKGNLHTHSLWSDGDQFPEVIVDWYARHGYQFLALSDHNILLRGDRWIPAATNASVGGTGAMTAFEIYRERFGEAWVETREREGRFEVRLKPLGEFRHRFEQAGQFLLIEAEEITEQKHVVHVNAANIVEYIEPRTGPTVEETIRLNIEAVHEQSQAHGQPMLPHLNHPNFLWAVRAEDMVPIRELKFFEVYNGHRGVANFGDDLHVDLDRMWDIVLTRRLAEENLGIVYALAVDDAHHYENSRSQVARPGRGWVMVRSQFLTPNHLIRAMEQGDFYASTGVEVDRIEHANDRFTVTVQPKPGDTYTIQFIGTRRDYDRRREPKRDADGNPLTVTMDYSADIGRVLKEVQADRATYEFDGDELYVRARILSSRLKENPFAEGEREQAWTQPVLPAVHAGAYAKAPVKVVTYNIRYNNPGDGENIWANRREAMVAYLRGTKADIIGLQEVEPPQRAYLAEALTEYAWYGVGRNAEHDEGEGTPIFYRRDRFDLQDSGTFWLSPTPEVSGDRGWDAALPRVASWVRLRDRQSGRGLLAVNTHFDHRGAEARLESGRMVVDKIHELAAAGVTRLPVILTGDFNCRPDSAPYAAITKAEDPSLRLLDAQLVSRTPHTGGDSTSNGFKAISPGNKIDHIFVRDVSAVLSHRIEDPRVDGRFVSDHLPIVAEIEITGAP